MEIDGVHQFYVRRISVRITSIDIQLQMIRGSVPDSDGSTTAIPIQMIEFNFL